MPYVAPIDEKKEEDLAWSCWYLSELLHWNELGLLPLKQDTDIENYCSFQGAYEIANWFKDVVTLVHGPAGCVTSFGYTRAYPGASKRYRPEYISTNIDQKDIIYGASDKLFNALIKVDETLNPKLIIVLTNCCTDITGEKAEAIIKKLTPQLKSDVINLSRGGCSGIGFRKGSDEMFEKLFEYISKNSKYKKDASNPTINLFTKRIAGRPAEVKDVGEITRLLEKVGIGINTWIRLGTSYDELMKIPLAHANATFCYSFGDEPMRILNSHFGQPYAQVTSPIGLEGTLEWINIIAKLVGVENKLTDDPEVEIYSKKIKSARAKYEGKKAIIWLSGEKGLALAKFVTELGMKPYLFSMSYYATEQLKNTIKLLLDKGYNFPAILRGKLDFLATYREIPHNERPIIFMPRKFWEGELPTATVNFFYDSIIGFKGIDFLLHAIDKAISTAGKKDYYLFNRYVETRYQAINYELDGPPMRDIDHDNPKWREFK